MDDVENIGNAYMDHSVRLAQASAVEDLLSRVRSRAKPAEGQPGSAPSPAGAKPPVAPEAQPGILSTVADYARRVRDDLGRGFVEAPAAVASGIYDFGYNATRGAGNALNSVGDWLNENVADLRVDVPLTGIPTLDAIIANPTTGIPGAMPDRPPAQQSTTGGVIREAARFLTGFNPALRLFGHSAGGVIAAGAMSDAVGMDPNQQGLSNLIQAVPALQNPVTEFLATDPDDPEALNRLRHAIEGAGFGALSEGISRGIKAIAHARRAVPEIEAQKMLYGEMTPGARDTLMVASPDAPLVVKGASPVDKLAKSVAATETGVPTAVAAKGVAGSADDAAKAGLTPVIRDAPPGAAKGAAKAADDPIYINFARMSSPDDVKQVIRDMADAFKGDINQARRGVQTNQQTKALADKLGMTVDDLLSRQAGEPLNAEKALAARRLLDTSAGRLLDLAKAAADPNAPPAAQFNFRRMLAVHHAIQSEVISARTETARALQSWSIPAGGNVEMARNVQLMLDSMGGVQTSQELARRMAMLAAQGVPEGALANMVQRGWAATTVDAVKESFVMGLLWSPKTHIVNTASNTAVAFQQVYERGAAAKFGGALGSAVDQRVADGEAIAMAYGSIKSMKDAFRLAWRSLRTGETGASLNKIDLPRTPAISAEAVSRELGHSPLEMARFAEGPMGRAVDFIGAATRAPGRLLGAEDEFFKTIAYRAEVHAQSLRQATQEGLKGPALWQRMAQLANSPPEHIKIAAADAALYATFNSRPGEWAQALMTARSAGTLNPTFAVLPFVRTPANILRYTFERSPLAPLVGQWRADIMAGGARRDLALARMATGSAIIAVALDYASSGVITGPGPSDQGQKEALMRTGWQPWSVYVDGKYHSYNRTDPIGTQIGMAATIAEMMKAKELSPEDFDTATEVLAHMIGGASQAVVDKTYFRGVMEFMTMLQGAEQGEGGVSNYINRLAGSVMPATTAMATVEAAYDPVTREVNSASDAWTSRIAGLSEKLPPARDLWGNERKPQEVYGRAYDALSPIAVTAAKDSPIDAEMIRNQIGVDRIKKKTDFAGARVDFRSYPQVYDEYVRLAGNELKHPAYGLGARDFLDAIVSGKHPLSTVYQLYSDGPEGGKAAFIKKTVSEFRQLAQQDIMARAQQEFPEFAATVQASREQRFENRLPIPLQGGQIKQPQITPPRVSPPSSSRAPSATGFQAQ